MTQKQLDIIRQCFINLELVLTFLLFLGLQLSGYIDWSWWWITSPLWIPMLTTPIIHHIENKINNMEN